jgi:hypothetical protein
MKVDKIMTVEDLIQDILSGVLSVGIEVPWRTNAPDYSGSERDSETLGDSGFDLAGIKEWEPGDRLAPRPTAKTGWRTKYTLVFEQPRDLTVYVLVENSKSVDFGVVRHTKKELSAWLMGSVLQNTACTNDLLGYSIWSGNKIHQLRTHRPAGRLIQQGLFGYLDEDSEEDGFDEVEGQSGLVQSLERLPMDRRCLVFIISDWQNYSAADKDALEAAAEKHDVIALVVGDRRERELPDGTGFRDLEDLGTGGVSGIHLSDKTRRQWRESFDAQRQELRKTLVDFGGSMQEFWTDQDVDGLNETILPIYSGHRPKENDNESDS